MEIRECNPLEYFPQARLHRTPERADGAIRDETAVWAATRVTHAEFLREELAPDHRDDLPDADLIGRPGEPVATGCTPGARDQAPQAELLHQQPNVLGTERLPTGDLGGVHRPRTLMEGDLQEAAETVLISGRNTHIEQQLIKEYLVVNIDYFPHPAYPPDRVALRTDAS